MYFHQPPPPIMPRNHNAPTFVYKPFSYRLFCVYTLANVHVNSSSRQFSWVSYVQKNKTKWRRWAPFFWIGGFMTMFPRGRYQSENRGHCPGAVADLEIYTTEGPKFGNQKNDSLSLKIKVIPGTVLFFSILASAAVF